MSENLEIKTKEEFEKILIERDTSKRFLKFKNCSFHFDIEIEHALVEIDCTGCTFENGLKINCQVYANSFFKDCEFKGKVDFSNSLFSKKVRIHNSTFHEYVLFNNTKFNDLADFWNTRFKKIVIFYKTDFLNTTVFSVATFEENVLFTYTLIKEHLILRGANFEKGIDLSLSILKGKINLFGLNLKNYDSINDFENEIDYVENVELNGLITHKNKRETFRILKKELLSQGNVIDALSMASNEKSAYQNQLKDERKIKKGKWFRRIQNRFILFLGKISNAHGESWTRSVGFTMLVGLFFFYCALVSTEKYYISFDCTQWYENFKTSVEYYFRFMLPTHKIDYMTLLKPTPVFYFWDFLGRIFVSFGIYQTIVAFRKYHSK